jgi:hypothetical protein
MSISESRKSGNLVERVLDSLFVGITMFVRLRASVLTCHGLQRNQHRRLRSVTFPCPTVRSRSEFN